MRSRQGIGAQRSWRRAAAQNAADLLVTLIDAGLLPFSTDEPPKTDASTHLHRSRATSSNLEALIDELQGSELEDLIEDLRARLKSADKKSYPGTLRQPAPPEAPGPCVFLCHSSDDKPAVKRLERRLREDGVRTWLDERELVPGQDWDHTIRQAVRNADIVLVCLSRGSITKAGYLQKEIRHVLDVADEQPDGTIFVIPARLDECDVPDRFRRWHWVDLYRRGGYTRLISAIRQAGDGL